MDSTYDSRQNREYIFDYDRKYESIFLYFLPNNADIIRLYDTVT